MKKVTSIAAMQRQAQAWRREGLTLALVPTMGCLHEGHASLIRRARCQADRLVVSVFVNPAQFGPHDDYQSYPQRMKQDLTLCQSLDVDAVFAPVASAMYAEDHSAFVDETRLSEPLCGRVRPGHFRGVATIVVKLFNIVAPHVALFGQKDAQQAAVVRRVVRDLNIPVKIRLAPTVREADGLAMSSRNVRLSPAERAIAPALWQALQAVRRHCRRQPCSPADLRKVVSDVLDAHKGLIALEYIEPVHPQTLRAVTTVQQGTLVAIAARIGGVRLVDNIRV